MQQNPVRGSFWVAVQREKQAQIREEATQNFHAEMQEKHPAFFSALSELEDRGYDISAEQKIFDVIEEDHSYSVGLDVRITSPQQSGIVVYFRPEEEYDPRSRGRLEQPFCEIRPLDAQKLLKLNPDIDTIHAHDNSAAHDTFRATDPENVMFLLEAVIAQVERHDSTLPEAPDCEDTDIWPDPRKGPVDPWNP